MRQKSVRLLLRMEPMSTISIMDWSKENFVNGVYIGRR